MKTNPIMESCRKFITPEIKRDVELSMFIAGWIMDVLKEKHLTQRQFAKLLGKSESEISAWLCGTHVFTTTTIAKIETILGRRLIETNRKKDHLAIEMKYNVIFCQESPKSNNDNWLTSLSNMKSYVGRPKECKLTC